MSSYFFHSGDEAGAHVAPPPPEYVEFTQRRAVWEALGMRKHEMRVRDWYHTLSFLSAEAAHRSKKAD